VNWHWATCTLLRLLILRIIAFFYCFQKENNRQMFIMARSNFFKNEVSYIGRVRKGRSMNCPFCRHCNSAGFSSHAEDDCESFLDLNELMVKNTEATFFLRMQGYSMENAGIFHGDIVVVDRSVVESGNIVIAVMQGCFTISRLIKKGGRVWLKPENVHYPSIEVKNLEDFEIWGTVVYTIRKL
jgi:DNA polymerase V